MRTQLPSRLDDHLFEALINAAEHVGHLELLTYHLGDRQGDGECRHARGRHTFAANDHLSTGFPTHFQRHISIDAHRLLDLQVLQILPGEVEHFLLEGAGALLIVHP